MLLRSETKPSCILILRLILSLVWHWPCADRIKRKIGIRGRAEQECETANERSCEILGKNLLVSTDSIDFYFSIALAAHITMFEYFKTFIFSTQNPFTIFRCLSCNYITSVTKKASNQKSNTAIENEYRRVGISLMHTADYRCIFLFNDNNAVC